jgi:hypothetical protein
LNESNNKTSETGKTVISISVLDEKYKAITLQRGGAAGGFKVVGKKSGQLDGLQEFLSEPSQQSANVVFCASSKSVAFYKIDIPAVPHDRMDVIVKMQAESLLPLPSEHVRFKWRAGQQANGKMPVTIAAGKTSLLEKTIQDGNIRGASKVLLDCEGTARAWGELLATDAAVSIIIKMNSDQSRILLCEGGQLSHSATIDIGLDDLSGPENFNDNVGLLSHDLRNAIEMFGLGRQRPEVFLLTPPGQNQQRLLSYLNNEGINACSARVDTRCLEMTETDIYEYFDVLGAAMMALDSDGGWLNLFEGLYTPPKSSVASFGMSLKRQIIFAAVSLVLLLLVCFAVDKLSLSRLNKLMAGVYGDNKISATEIAAQQKLRKIVAVGRGDIIGLLTKINQCCDGGMMLDSLSYRRKDNKVSIAGAAGSWEQLYKLEKDLKGQKEILNIKIQNPSSSKGKINYTITFNYGKASRGKSI